MNFPTAEWFQEQREDQESTYAEAIERRIDAGVTKFQGWFADCPDTSGMELFADEVIPQFQ